MATGGGGKAGAGKDGAPCGTSICGGGTAMGRCAMRDGRLGMAADPRQLAAAALRSPSTAPAAAPPARALCSCASAEPHSADFNGSPAWACANAAPSVISNAQAIFMLWFAGLSDSAYGGEWLIFGDEIQ